MGKEIFKSSRDDESGTFTQDKISVTDENTGSHEHTWSKTTEDSHNEGWHGDGHETANNKPKE